MNGRLSKTRSLPIGVVVLVAAVLLVVGPAIVFGEADDLATVSVCTMPPNEKLQT